MSISIRNLLKISRPEFIPANSASLIIGVAWGLMLPVDLVWGLAIPLILAYVTITLVAAYAAQINTLSDYESDAKDINKKDLVQALNQINRHKLKIVMTTEIILSLVPLTLLIWLLQKPEMILFWAAAVFLAHTYSAPPLRLKSRGIYAVLSLLLVLSILPITFVTYTFTRNLTMPFWLFLIGQALTVYGIIVPAEIRDYFNDKQTCVITNTVKIGLTKASLLGIGLLAAGGTLAATALVIHFAQTDLPWLAIFVLAMGVTYAHILRKYWKLYDLSRQHAQAHAAKEQENLAKNIINVASENPKWITLVTQVIMMMCIVLLASKFL